MFSETNCCIHRPKRIDAVRSQHCSSESELKRTRGGSPFRGRGRNAVLTTMNQTAGKSDHSTYFALHFILFEHLELLEHRATSTAGKSMLF